MKIQFWSSCHNIAEMAAALPAGMQFGIESNFNPPYLEVAIPEGYDYKALILWSNAFMTGNCELNDYPTYSEPHPVLAGETQDDALARITAAYPDFLSYSFDETVNSIVIVRPFNWA